MGGVEVFTTHLSQILKRKGHDVDIISRERLAPGPKEDLEKEVGALFTSLNKTKAYDVVVCNGEFGYCVEHPKAINVLHGNYFGYAKAVEGRVDTSIVEARLRKVERQVLSSLGKYVVTVSQFNRQELEKLGISVNQVINHSVDPSVFYPTKTTIEDHALAVSRGNAQAFSK